MITGITSDTVFSDYTPIVFSSGNVIRQSGFHGWKALYRSRKSYEAPNSARYVNSICAVEVDSNSLESENIDNFLIAKIKSDESKRPDFERPTFEVLQIEKYIQNVIYQFRLKPTRRDLSAEGGVNISFFKGDKYADIEILNCGEVLAVTSDRKSDPDVWKIELNTLYKALSKIGDFLNG